MSSEQTKSTRVEALQPLPQRAARSSVNGSSTGGAKEQDRIVTQPADALHDLGSCIYLESLEIKVLIYRR